jgi:hypothetical protein
MPAPSNVKRKLRVAARYRIRKLTYSTRKILRQFVCSVTQGFFLTLRLTLTPHGGNTRFQGGKTPFRAAERVYSQSLAKKLQGAHVLAT